MSLKQEKQCKHSSCKNCAAQVNWYSPSAWWSWSCWTPSASAFIAATVSTVVNNCCSRYLKSACCLQKASLTSFFAYKYLLAWNDIIDKAQKRSLQRRRFASVDSSNRRCEQQPIRAKQSSISKSSLWPNSPSPSTRIDRLTEDTTGTLAASVVDRGRHECSLNQQASVRFLFS